MVKYVWKCKYYDGSIIDQFDDSGNETTFDKLDLEKIELFELIADSDCNIKSFMLNLSNGAFYLNGIILNLFPKEQLITSKRKLIYFRRNRETFSPIGKIGSNQVSVLGFEQVREQMRELFNVMFIIHEDGNGILRLYKK